MWLLLLSLLAIVSELCIGNLNGVSEASFDSLREKYEVVVAQKKSVYVDGCEWQSFNSFHSCKFSRSEWRKTWVVPEGEVDEIVAHVTDIDTDILHRLYYETDRLGYQEVHSDRGIFTFLYDHKQLTYFNESDYIAFSFSNKFYLVKKVSNDYLRLLWALNLRVIISLFYCLEI
uniref:Dipeptidylpeptidase IV N-terminal domain-containing protein n=1 Tax=Parascaris equorum TaxID=6256 RepID=A0A914RRC0_PAREQ